LIAVKVVDCFINVISKEETYIKYDAETVGWQAIPAKPIIAQCVLFYQSALAFKNVFLSE